MTNYKTFSGLIKATKKASQDLFNTKIDSDREYQHHNRIVKNLTGQLDGLWTNPAQADEAREARSTLIEMWNSAIGVPSVG